MSRTLPRTSSAASIAAGSKWDPAVVERSQTWDHRLMVVFDRPLVAGLPEAPTSPAEAAQRLSWSY